MTDKRTLRAVIRGILSEVDGPNDPKSPRNPAYYSMPSKLSIAATALPTVFTMMEDIGEDGFIQNDFPVINIESLPETASQTDIKRAVDQDYRDLVVFYDTLLRLGSLSWPAQKLWGNLETNEKTDVDDLIKVIMSPKCKVGVVSADLIIKKIRGNATSHTDFLNYIINYVKSCHELFQNRVKIKLPTSDLLSKEEASYRDVIKHLRTLTN